MLRSALGVVVERRRQRARFGDGGGAGHYLGLRATLLIGAGLYGIAMLLVLLTRRGTR